MLRDDLDSLAVRMRVTNNLLDRQPPIGKSTQKRRTKLQNAASEQSDSTKKCPRWALVFLHQHAARHSVALKNCVSQVLRAVSRVTLRGSGNLGAESCQTLSP
jgi:hypothetical protein